jgi:hypothetical protein
LSGEESKRLRAIDLTDNTKALDPRADAVVSPSLELKKLTIVQGPPFQGECWARIDHGLAKLKIVDLAEEMNAQVAANERRIRFENRTNSNTNTLPSLLLEMQRACADEQIRRIYGIYRQVWQIQGFPITADFIRTVYARALRPALRARTNAIASKFERFAHRTGFPSELQNAHIRRLRMNMQRLDSRWYRQIEIEARQIQHHPTAPSFQDTVSNHPASDRLRPASSWIDSSASIEKPKSRPKRTKLTKRKTVIFAAIKMGLKGHQYCSFLDKHGVRLVLGDEGTVNYAKAYKENLKLRKKIQDDKTRAREKMRQWSEPELRESFLLYLNDEFDSIIHAIHSQGSQKASKTSLAPDAHKH